MAFRSLVVAPWLLACVTEEPLGTPGKNMTGPVTSGSPTGGETETETGAPSDVPACDPLADPESECGPGMACDLTSGICEPAPGDGLEDEACANDEECSPGLICFDGRCRALCDASLDEGCNDAQICAAAVDPIPGLCLTSCELAFDTCPFGDACKRVIGPGADVYAACVGNLGVGLTGDACNTDPECAPGYLCTESQFHTLPCANQAASCCASICDGFELPCFGIEPICYALDIPGQETAGFCGV